MYAWLLGKCDSNVLLVKIKLLDKKLITLTKKIHDKNNATFIAKNFIIESIVDEYLQEYFLVDIPILETEISIKIMRAEKSIQYENIPVVIYLTKERALSDVYLFNDKATGSFFQYSKSGKLICKIMLKRGKIIGCSDSS